MHELAHIKQFKLLSYNGFYLSSFHNINPAPLPPLIYFAEFPSPFPFQIVSLQLVFYMFIFIYLYIN